MKIIDNIQKNVLPPINTRALWIDEDNLLKIFNNGHWQGVGFTKEDETLLDKIDKEIGTINNDIDIIKSEIDIAGSPSKHIIPLLIGNDDETKASNLKKLQTLTDAADQTFFADINYGYGTASWLPTKGGTAFIINDDGNALSYTIGADGSCIKNTDSDVDLKKSIDDSKFVNKITKLSENAITEYFVKSIYDNKIYSISQSLKKGTGQNTGHVFLDFTFQYGDYFNTIDKYGIHGNTVSQYNNTDDKIYNYSLSCDGLQFDINGNNISYQIVRLGKEGLVFRDKTVKDIPSCKNSFIHIGDTDDATLYTQVAPITNGKIPSRYIPDISIDKKYLYTDNTNLVLGGKNNASSVQLLFKGGIKIGNTNSSGKYITTEYSNNQASNNYFATDGSIQSITDKIDEAIENKVDAIDGVADYLTVTSQLVVTSSTATQGGESGGTPDEGITITPTGIIIDTDYDNDDGIFLTNGTVASLTDKISAYMTAHPSSSSSDVGLSYNNTFTGEINTFKGRVALGSDSSVVNLKGINSNDFKGLELGIYDNAKCGIKTHSGESNEYYATDGSLQNITTKIAEYIKANPVNASITAATPTAIGGVKQIAAPAALSASASNAEIIARVNSIITALTSCGVFKGA